MCSNYQPPTIQQLEQHFGVAPPDSDYASEAFPGRMAPMIRRPRADAMHGDRACALGMFGLVPAWAEPKLARSTYNARSETVASKPSFRHAWKRGQFCIIPAASFSEPNYESGKPVRWEIGTGDAALGIAGIWEQKTQANGLLLLSFSMLTINADDHPLMRRFHRPTDEKRMIVILRPEQYDDWLHCTAEEAPAFLQPYPAKQMTAHAAPLSSK